MKLNQVGYRDWITARTPDLNEQNFFRIQHDATVFEVFRTGFDQNRKPMRVTVMVFPADRNQFIVNVGDVPAPSTTWGMRLARRTTRTADARNGAAGKPGTPVDAASPRR